MKISKQQKINMKKKSKCSSPPIRKNKLIKYVENVQSNFDTENQRVKLVIEANLNNDPNLIF